MAGLFDFILPILFGDEGSGIFDNLAQVKRPSVFAIGEHCVVTNAHVIDSEEMVYLTTYFGDRERAGVERIDEELDIAILNVPDIVNIKAEHEKPRGVVSAGNKKQLLPKN